MNYSECLSTVDLIIASNDVPLIIGESGVGKTSLVKYIARDNEYYLVTIDANLLKEGEIGGLPIVENRVTIYATHNKLIEIEKALKENESRDVILFIDELNRCDHAVAQELMNLILNKEINGYILNERVKVIAAMNPSNKNDGFYNSNYDVYYYALTMNREKLYERINKRVDIMMDKGLLEEVKGLKDKGFTSEMQSMKGIGYKEILDYFQGKNTLQEAIDTIKQGSRNYAKRQLTWFRKNELVQWIDKDEFKDEDKIIDFIMDKL